MIPHWDLRKGQRVSLLSPSGRRQEAVFDFSDTIHACFRIQGKLREFTKMDDGRVSERETGAHFSSGTQEWRTVWNIWPGRTAKAIDAAEQHKQTEAPYAR